MANVTAKPRNTEGVPPNLAAAEYALILPGKVLMTVRLS